MTEEWLTACGIPWGMTDGKGGFIIDLYYGSGWKATIALIDKTRHDVRLLAKALGITLKEASNG